MIAFCFNSHILMMCLSFSSLSSCLILFPLSFIATIPLVSGNILFGVKYN